MQNRAPDLIAVCGDLYKTVSPERRPIEQAQPHVLPFLRACVKIRVK